jgi:Domain of Unknown Function (DUF1080)
MRNITLILLIYLLQIETPASAQKDWISLFNGKDLTGWVQKGGSAIYKVEGAMIVGSTTLNSPNSFLCTDKNYDNFILELDFKVDSNLNSGIQIRSESNPDYQSGRVHGYQIEIDPSKRAFTGGIYDEARRGWLVPLTTNVAARTAFKQGEWNHFRIEAISDSLRVWLNNIPSAWLIDNSTHSGFIGLQVHDIGKDSLLIGLKVRFRNIRILTQNVTKYFNNMDPLITQVNMIPNILSPLELSNGWKLLFDGMTTKGWRKAHKKYFPEKGWIVRNGCLIVEGSKGEESANGGDIVTMDEYANFEISLEYKLTKGANSGIKYYVTEKENPNGSAIGLEYQLLDNETNPDAKLGNHEGSRVNAALYDLIKPINTRENAIGEWNRARIISNGTHVEHWLNGFKVLEYERGSDEFKSLVCESKYKKWKNFGLAQKGHILLQDHGNEVWFRSIKIREL